MARDPLLNLRAAELLRVHPDVHGIWLDREDAELVLEALAEIAEVKREREAWLEQAQRSDRLATELRSKLAGRIQ